MEMGEEVVEEELGAIRVSQWICLMRSLVLARNSNDWAGTIKGT
jgi:hypothetical protein